MNNHILIKGDPIQKEGNAAETITPGELITFDGSGDIIPHGSAGENAQPRFAKEEDYGGQSIDTDYAAGERVPYYVNRKGDEVQAFLAAGQNVAKDTPLVSDGSGGLTAYTAPTAVEDVYPNAIVAYAAEAKDNSGSAERARIKVEVA